MTEATSCPEAAQPMQALLADWSERLMTETPPTNGI